MIPVAEGDEAAAEEPSAEEEVEGATQSGHKVPDVIPHFFVHFDFLVI